MITESTQLQSPGDATPLTLATHNLALDALHFMGEPRDLRDLYEFLTCITVPRPWPFDALHAVILNAYFTARTTQPELLSPCLVWHQIIWVIETRIVMQQTDIAERRANGEKFSEDEDEMVAMIEDIAKDFKEEVNRNAT